MGLSDSFRIKRYRPKRYWLLVFVCLLVNVALNNDVFGAGDQRAKRVLIISTGSRLAPGFILADRQLLQALGNIQSERIEIYAENLDLVRFPIERYQRLFGEYLTGKYADSPPDVVVLVFVGNLETPAKLLPKIFPETPIVVAGFTEEEIRPNSLGAFISGVAQRVNPGANLDLIRLLQPEARRIVVIGGTTDIDRQVLQRVREAAKSFQGQLKIEFWDDLSMAELQKAVKVLPSDSAILFARVFRDAAGQALISSQVARLIAEWANVPVYVMSDANMGSGAVGGSLASVEAFAQRAGAMVTAVLRGTDIKSLAFEISTNSVPTFDWGALQRWNIPETRLPRGSVVLHRPTSIWMEYRWYIIGVLVVIALQGAMIADLLLHRRRRHRAEAELAESRQFMELATEAGGIGLWVRDLIHGDLWANSRMRSLLGFGLGDDLKVDDVLGRIHSEDRQQMMSVIERAQETGKPFEVEFRTAVPGASERWIAARGQFVRGAQDQVLRRMGTMIDITERKRAEDKFRLAVEASPSAIVMADEHGRIVLVNARTETLFGYAREELFGRPVDILVPDLFRGHHPAFREDVARAPQTPPMGAGRDLYARRKDGSEVRVEIGLTPIQTQDGLFVLTSIVDISARKQAEEELEKERAFLRQVIDIDPNFIFAKDREGRFTLANQAVAEAYGTTVENLIGKTDAEFNPHAEEVERFHRMDLEVIDTLQERFVPEEPITDATGKIRWLQTVKRPIIERDGLANQVLGASTDITGRKAAEAELQRNRDELAHMTRVSTLGELAASLAHELNQPLTGILSNAQAAQRFLALTPADLDEVREILKDIVEDDNRASEVIQKLRALYKKEALTFAPLGLPGVINDVVQLMHSDAVLHNVRIALETDVDLPTARGDRVQLQQVVLNLLRNAIDAMTDCVAKDRMVSVRAQRQAKDFLRVAVSDRGTGLATDKIDKIFQPFYTTKSHGLGMGLSVSRSIIEAHGGRLWAENNPDRGMTFYFTVPVAGE